MRIVAIIFNVVFLIGVGCWAIPVVDEVYSWRDIEVYQWVLFFWGIGYAMANINALHALTNSQIVRRRQSNQVFIYLGRWPAIILNGVFLMGVIFGATYGFEEGYFVGFSGDLEVFLWSSLLLGVACPIVNIIAIICTFRNKKTARSPG